MVLITKESKSDSEESERVGDDDVVFEGCQYDAG
jgi:hypothetical protein